jgi:hypothetical protein
VTEHLADVETDAKKPVNRAALAVMEKTDRLVLRQADTRYLACSFSKERDTARKPPEEAGSERARPGCVDHGDLRGHEGRPPHVAPDLLLPAGPA